MSIEENEHGILSALFTDDTGVSDVRHLALPLEFLGSFPCWEHSPKLPLGSNSGGQPLYLEDSTEWTLHRAGAPLAASSLANQVIICKVG